MNNVILNTIHTANFYTEENTKALFEVCNSVTFIEDEFGKRSENLNLRQPWADKVFSNVLNTNVTVPEETGYFHIPTDGIHFSSFSSLNEWVFTVAIQPTIFNTYHHKSGIKTALDGYKLNFKNLFEWDYVNHILLEPGQGIFYRPWCFHSFSSNKLIQKYNLNAINKDAPKTILVMGHSGSGKTTLSKQLAEKLSCPHINADQVRMMYNDWDFSYDGRERQSQRMKKLSLLAESKVVIVDFICPRQSTRDIFDADFIVWMNTIEKSKYDDTNSMFEPPTRYNERITSLNYSVDDLCRKIKDTIS